MRIRAVALLLLALSAALSCAPSCCGAETSAEKVLWQLGVPRVLDWSSYGLAVGTTAGYVLVYDAQGNLLWSRKLNYTEVGGVSWSESGKLAVLMLGPPSALYVFSDGGDLLWSVEFEDSQMYAAVWSGNLLAVAASGSPGLSVFDERGKLAWRRSGGGVLAISWHDGLLAAAACLDGPGCGWKLHVFDKSGVPLWSYEGWFSHVSWSGGGDLAAYRHDGAKPSVMVFDRFGKLKWEKPASKSVAALTWFGSLLAVVDESGITVYNESGGVAWVQTDERSITALLPYGAAFLAADSSSGNLTLLDARGRPIWSYRACGYLWGLASYGGLIAAASSDGYLQVLDGSGNLVWRRRVGFWVEAVSLSGNLVAVGGWDLNTTVLDLDGNVKWSRETGWVRHLAWHGELLAVGGYEELSVFDKDGNLLWGFKTGKVRALSWSSDGLLAVGTSDRFGVFSGNGSLLWSFGTPNWVISVSWSGELLAVAVAGSGVYVFDKTGSLRWGFGSLNRGNSTVPWWVAASWWGDMLLVFTDRLYALDRNGSVLWARDIGAEYLGMKVIAPGGELAALGSGSGVYVLDRDGEVEWAYAAPEPVKPKDRFTKPYPEWVYSLSWAGGYLAVGDSLGRVFLFNETGDLVKVYSTGGPVFSTSADEHTFVAGGGGGLLLGRVPAAAPKPVKKVLLELPQPYSRFELAIANKTILRSNGSLTLAPPQYAYFSFEVSEPAAYAFLEARLRSSSPVKFMVMDEKEFGNFTRKLHEIPELSWTGNEIEVKARLAPGKYFAVIDPAAEAEARVAYSIYAYESALPSFERGRASLPVGVADYGVAELPEGRIGYRYSYAEAWGAAAIHDLHATRAFDREDTRHWVTLQLNAFLQVRVKGGEHVYWIQNVLVIDTEGKRVRVASNVWNLTTYPTSTLAAWAVKGNGSIARERRTGDYYFYAPDEWVSYDYPLEAILYLAATLEDGVVKVYFGQALGWRSTAVYDTVMLSISAESASFRVDPAASPVPNNVELVLGGPRGDKPKTDIDRVNASLRLLVKVGGELVPVPTAYSYGYFTAERVAGASAGYGGFYNVAVAKGRTVPHQAYYSTGPLPSMRVLWISDPLGLFSGVRIVGAGEEPEVPVGYAVDLGNMTRLLLKRYEVSGNKLRLHWVRQYYLAISSDYGTVEGEGWYDEGSGATVSVSPTAVTTAFGEYIFQGWEREGVVVSTSPTHTLRVEAPVSLKARWSKAPPTAPPAAVVVAAAALAAAVAAVAVARRRSKGKPRAPSSSDLR